MACLGVDKVQRPRPPQLNLLAMCSLSSGILAGGNAAEVAHDLCLVAENHHVHPQTLACCFYNLANKHSQLCKTYTMNINSILAMHCLSLECWI